MNTTSLTRTRIFRTPRVCRNPSETPKAPIAFYQLPEIIQNTLDAYVTVQHLMMRENSIKEKMLYYADSKVIDLTQKLYNITQESHKRQQSIDMYITNLMILINRLRSIMTDII